MAVPPDADVVAEQFEMMEAVNAPLAAWMTFAEDLAAKLVQPAPADNLSHLRRLLDRVNAKIVGLKAE